MDSRDCKKNLQILKWASYTSEL